MSFIGFRCRGSSGIRVGRVLEFWLWIFLFVVDIEKVGCEVC